MVGEAGREERAEAASLACLRSLPMEATPEDDMDLAGGPGWSWSDDCCCCCCWFGVGVEVSMWSGGATVCDEEGRPPPSPAGYGLPLLPLPPPMAEAEGNQSPPAVMEVLTAEGELALTLRSDPIAPLPMAFRDAMLPQGLLVLLELLPGPIPPPLPLPLPPGVVGVDRIPLPPRLRLPITPVVVLPLAPLIALDGPPLLLTLLLLLVLPLLVLLLLEEEDEEVLWLSIEVAEYEVGLLVTLLFSMPNTTGARFLRKSLALSHSPSMRFSDVVRWGDDAVWECE